MFSVKSMPKLLAQSIYSYQSTQNVHIWTTVSVKKLRFNIVEDKILHQMFSVSMNLHIRMQRRKKKGKKKDCKFVEDIRKKTKNHPISSPPPFKKKFFFLKNIDCGIIKASKKKKMEEKKRRNKH